MPQLLSGLRYIGVLLTLIIVISACTGAEQPASQTTSEPEVTAVALVPTSQASPIPGERRNTEEDRDGDGLLNDADSCPDMGDMGYGIDEFGCPTDTDKDGFPDHVDMCITEFDLGYGTDEFGCPNPNPDSDGDGVLDYQDACPTEGNTSAQEQIFPVDATGCPQDLDFDGIKDNLDACPDVGDMGQGVDPSGCPIIATDSDGDGIVDEEDQCPTEGNITVGDVNYPVNSFGCQMDTDDDGIYDYLDTCPLDGDLGLGIYADGCPVEADADRDGDGFFDADDQCPEEGNIQTNGDTFAVDDTGCQADTDGDGVKDYLDLCINDGIRGFVDPDGCSPSGAEVTPDAPLPTVSVYIIESICLYVPELNIMRLQITIGNNGTVTISGDAQWQFSNGSTVESGFWGMTDYTGDVRADFAPSDTRLYRANIGANGFVTFSSDYLTYTNPEPCFVPDAELQVTDVVCQYNMFEDRMELIFTLTNVGQGYLNADAQYTFIGATTVTNYISPFVPREPLAPNATTSFSMNPDANGFATLMVAEYITYTNPTPCLPAPEATPEVTTVPEITPEATDVPEITPEVTPTEVVTPNPNPITLPNNVPNLRITGATCGASGTFNNAFAIVELYQSGDYASSLLSALAPLNLDERTQSLLSQLSAFASETSVVITYGTPYDPNNPTNMVTALQPVALSPTGVFTDIQIPYTLQSAPPPNQAVYFNIKDVYARGVATQFVLMPFLDKYNAGYALTTADYESLYAQLSAVASSPDVYKSDTLDYCYPFIISPQINIAEECDYVTGINTLYFVISYANDVNTLWGSVPALLSAIPPVTYTASSGETGTLPFSDGFYMVQIDTKSLTSLSMSYSNPDYLLQVAVQTYLAGSPDIVTGVAPYLTQSLSVCHAPIDPNQPVYSTVTQTCDPQAGMITVQFENVGINEALGSVNALDFPNNVDYSVNIYPNNTLQTLSTGSVNRADGVYTVQIELTTDLLNNFEDVYFSYLNFARIMPILQNGGTLGDLASYNSIIKLDVCLTPIVEVPENPIVLPTTPQLTITSATCPDKNSANVTVSVEDGSAINTAMADIYAKLGITEQMLAPYLSRFSGSDSLVVTLTKDAPATNIMGFGTLGFTTFSGSGESVVAVPILYLAYSNFPIYANLPNPYVVYEYLMTHLTPLVEKYNRGEYIFNADYDAFVVNLNNAPSNLLSSRISSVLIENCDIARTPISLTVTESCDFETGINTVILTLDASDMVAFLQSFPSGGESYVNFYEIDYAFHSGETGTIGLLDSVTIVDVQTLGYPEGVYVTYTNPDTINHAIQISFMGISDVVVGEAEITHPLQVCDVEITPEATPSQTELVAPTIPSIEISNLTCGNDGNLSATLTVSGVEAFNADITTFFTKIGLAYNPFVGIPGLYGDTVYISHTSPLHSVPTEGNVYSNLVATGTIPIATLTDGTFTIPLTISGTSPANSLLYASFVNPYKQFTFIFSAYSRLVTKVNNGQTPTQEDILYATSLLQDFYYETPYDHFVNQLFQHAEFVGYDLSGCVTITPEIPATGLAFPAIPSITVENMTCNDGNLTLSMNASGITAFNTGMTTVFTQIGLTYNPFVGIPGLFGNNVQVVISHTTPLYNVPVDENMPDNVVAVGTIPISTLTDGASSRGLTIYNIPPANAILYVTFANPYRLFPTILTNFQPLVNMVKLGETPSQEDILTATLNLQTYFTANPIASLINQTWQSIQFTVYDLSGCINIIPEETPTPEVTPIITPTEEVTPIITPEATVSVEPTLNMGIEVYCQYFYTQPTAVFVLSNPNEIVINASYTDQDGRSFPFSIPSNELIYEYITPNEQGVASIKIDGATNFAQVTNCFTAQLSVTRADCMVLDGMYFVELDIYNSGPGTVQSVIEWRTFGLETLTGYFNYLGGDTLTPNESLLIRAQPDAQGFLRVVVSDYNFSYTNPVPCLEGAPTAEVTPTEEITPIVTPTAEVTPEVISNLPIIPQLNCVDNNGDGTYTAYFGYYNLNNVTRIIPIGAYNTFTPPPAVRGQPTAFSAGIHERVFSVVFDGNPITWSLTAGGSTITATASSANTSCDGVTPEITPTPEVTPDIISNLPIIPQLNCVDNNGDRTYTAYFGYYNLNNVTRIITIGAYNTFTPPPLVRGQPTSFLAGIHERVFSVVFDGNPITWSLTSSHTLTIVASSASTPCVVITPEVTPTEYVTPEVTPTEYVTPEITPTEEITPIVTPTEYVTPEVTPTEYVTPEVTPTEEITPIITPTMEVTPDETPTSEITPIVTATETDIPPTLEPTSEPTPTEAVTPDVPVAVCGAISFTDDGFPQIDLSGAGCSAQEERPTQNWQPIIIGGAVCLPEIIYHTDETGDWEIFWASASRAPENLSDGAGFIDLAPTRSPDGAWIAFSSNRDGNWELYASSVDGSITIRLTDNDSAVDFDPSWSPDGTKIVYESNVDGNWELRMIDLLTGEKTRLTDNPAPDVNPTWHPDGTHIAFQSSRQDGLWQIYELEIATGIVTRLSDGATDDINPQYSPDGDSILYKSFTSELRSLFIMNRAGEVTATVNITNTNVNYGIWSSDGMYIAMEETRFDGSTSIIIYEVATGIRRQLTADGASAFSPAWICDTTNVVFTSNALGNNNLYVLSATPMDGVAIDVTTLEPIIGGDANQRDPQNSPAEEDASRAGNLPPK